MLPGFCNIQNSTTPNPSESHKQVSATPEASMIGTASMINNNNSVVNNDSNAENGGNTIHNNTNETSTENEVFLYTRNIADQRDDNPDTADFHVNQGEQGNAQNSKLLPIHTETMLRTHCTHNEILNHYNCIVVGSFKDIFQGVDTNNLQAVLQALQELNFILANRAPKMSAHCSFPLEPHQISTEEVPDFITAYLSRPTTYPIDDSNRGRLWTRGNCQYRPSRQSSPVPRSNHEDRTRYTHRSDTYTHHNYNQNRQPHQERSSYQSKYGDRNRHHSYYSPNPKNSIAKLTITSITAAILNISHLICLC